MKSAAEIGMKIAAAQREYYRYAGVSEKAGASRSRVLAAGVHVGETAKG